MDSIVAGVDIGGSHVTAGLVDTSGRTVYTDTVCRQSVDAGAGAEEIITAWCAALKKSFSAMRLPAGKIGVAMPGPFDYQNGISYIKDQGKYDALYGRNVSRMMADELGIAPSAIKMENDAVCFLKGEVLGGSASGYQHVLCITLGTGFGSALYKNGEMKDAEHWCTPFKNDIAENYFCTRWFIRRYRELTGREAKNVKQLHSRIDTDWQVQQLFTELGYNLADFLAHSYAADMPDVVVLGGNIANAALHFIPLVNAGLALRNCNTIVKQAMLGEHAALTGAACGWVGEEKRMQVIPDNTRFN